MQFKPFFVHYNRPVRKNDSSKMRHIPRGFTVYVEPGEGRDVKLRGTWCSTKDQFCKDAGRKAALVAEMHSVNARKVPEILAAMTNEVEGETIYGDKDYYYLLKYMV